MKNTEYKMTVKIEGKSWKTGERETVKLKYKINFTSDGGYMCVESDDGHFTPIDIQCDTTFDDGEKDIYIMRWAKRHWSGKDEGYKLKAITIEKL